MAAKSVNVVLAHGAWADGSSWARVINALKSDGVNVVAAPLPLTSLADDVAALDRSLARVEGPFEDADAAHDLGEHEVRVGVALPLDVERNVDGDVPHPHLDARPVLQIEASKVHVIPEPFPILVIDKEAGSRGQHLARLLAR